MLHEPRLTNSHYAERVRRGGVQRRSGVLKYYWLCLYEIPIELEVPEISRQREAILNQLERERDDVAISMMRSVLARCE